MKFIFAADLHLRTDVPRCRKETQEQWIGLQSLQLKFIASEAFTYNCSVIICGDIFHKPNVTDEIKNIFINAFFDTEVYAIAGQHDLPQHSWDNVDKSSFGVIRNSGVIKSLKDIAELRMFGQPLVGTKTGLVFIHDLVFENKKSIPPNVNAKTADQILEEYPDATWIFCGDQHHHFHYKKQGRHVLMSGCMNRQASDFLNYEPCIHLIDTDAGTVKTILVPDDINMITDEHIQIKNEREDRIAAFVTLIKSSKKVSLDFESNVRAAILESKDLDEDTINMIEELMEA